MDNLDNKTKLDLLYVLNKSVNKQEQLKNEIIAYTHAIDKLSAELNMVEQEYLETLEKLYK